MPGYAELHCLTNYSFLRSASHPHELVERAMALGYEALAITDECSVAGVVKAFFTAKKLQSAQADDRPFQLLIGSEFRHPQLGVMVLIAPSRKAYGQLCRLITTARQRSVKGEYQVTGEDFWQHCSECLLLWQPADNEAVQHYATHFQTAFKDRLWLLYERHYGAGDVDIYQQTRRYQQQLNLPVVAAGYVQFHDQQRQPLHDVLTAIRLRQPIEAIKHELLPNQEFSLRPLSDLTHCYPAEWLAETLQVVKRCHFQLDELKYEYPAELVPAGLRAIDYLRQLTMAGAEERFPAGIRDDVKEKLEKELGLIEQLHYEYFFLTIHDLVRFAREHGILYQGRGSAANSVVCYCLQITAVNPAQIDVLFERFISAERDEPPDIDVDFEHQRREEVIQYIYQKYGRGRAALAATVITYRLRSAFRDVGKALGYNEQELQYYLQKIDKRDESESWQSQLLEQVPRLGETTRGQWLLKLVDDIRGFPRHLSQHVGGFVISAGPLSELVPIENASMPDRTVIQWDKDDLEALHLLKVDVLALGMLSALSKMLVMADETYGHSLGLADIPQEDARVYGMLQQGDSIGIFQVESRAQMSMLPRLKPATFYDLVIQIAIVRPGPIQGDMVHPYLRRRAGLEAVDYPSAEVAGVLTRTLGVPIFQEQVIKLAMVAAGFSGGEADQLRRAMASWKSTGQLKQFEAKLTNGMLARGYTADFAQRIYRQICGFGEYGFPESHSASFANLAYASAWFKYYYPAAFYAGLLNSLPMGFYSAGQLIQDAQRHQVVILPVDIQSSQWQHQLVKEHDQVMIRLGLRLVKGVTEAAMVKLVQQRPADGFRSIKQLQQLGVTALELDKLAAADAFSSLVGHRYQSRWEALALGEAQLPLLEDSFNEPMERLQSPSELADVAEDYKALGTSLRRHPVALLREQGALKGGTTAAELPYCRNKQFVRITGLVTCRQRPGTSSGVTFVTLEDETGNANIVIWLKIAKRFRRAYLTARLLQIKGIVEIHEGVTHVVAAQLIDFSEDLAVATNKSRTSINWQ